MEVRIQIVLFLVEFLSGDDRVVLQVFLRNKWGCWFLLEVVGLKFELAGQQQVGSILGFEFTEVVGVGVNIPFNK